MMQPLRSALCISLTLTAVPAAAQQVQAYVDSTTRKVVAVSTDHPLPVIGWRETFQLVNANVPAAGVVVFGGDYILTQRCSAYGTLTLQVLGPDDATWLDLASFAATDAGSGHGFPLGSWAKVRIALAGTTDCVALLSRVPA